MGQKNLRITEEASNFLNELAAGRRRLPGAQLDLILKCLKNDPAARARLAAYDASEGAQDAD